MSAFRHKISVITQDGARATLTDNWEAYASSHFGLAPRGNGQDTHRVWEMLYFGMVPIVISSALSQNGLYDEFSVLVLKRSYEELCGMDLNKIYQSFVDRKMLPVKDEKFTMGWWLKRHKAFEVHEGI